MGPGGPPSNRLCSFGLPGASQSFSSSPVSPASTSLPLPPIRRRQHGRPPRPRRSMGISLRRTRSTTGPRDPWAVQAVWLWVCVCVPRAGYHTVLAGFCSAHGRFYLCASPWPWPIHPVVVVVVGGVVSPADPPLSSTRDAVLGAPRVRRDTALRRGGQNLYMALFDRHGGDKQREANID